MRKEKETQSLLHCPYLTSLLHCGWSTCEWLTHTSTVKNLQMFFQSVKSQEQASSCRKKGGVSSSSKKKKIISMAVITVWAKHTLQLRPCCHRAALQENENFYCPTTPAAVSKNNTQRLVKSTTHSLPAKKMATPWNLTGASGETR